jgi:hypothetical protein
MEPIIPPHRLEVMRRPVLFTVAVLAAAFLAAPALFGQRLSLGFIGGANLTHDFSTAYQNPSGAPATSVLFSDSHSLILPDHGSGFNERTLN